METLKTVDENILKEKELIRKEKDAVKVNEFIKKVGETATKIPAVKEVWHKLGMAVEEGDQVFDKINVDLQAILKKTSAIEKGVKNAFDEVKVQESKK